MKLSMFALLLALTTTVFRPAYAGDFGTGLLLGVLLTITSTASKEAEQKGSHLVQGTRFEFSPMPVIKAKYPSGGAIVSINSTEVSQRVSNPVYIHSMASN